MTYLHHKRYYAQHNQTHYRTTGHRGTSRCRSRSRWYPRFGGRGCDNWSSHHRSSCWYVLSYITSLSQPLIIRNSRWWRNSRSQISRRQTSLRIESHELPYLWLWRCQGKEGSRRSSVSCSFTFYHHHADFQGVEIQQSQIHPPTSPKPLLSSTLLPFDGRVGERISSEMKVTLRSDYAFLCLWLYQIVLFIYCICSSSLSWCISISLYSCLPARQYLNSSCSCLKAVPLPWLTKERNQITYSATRTFNWLTLLAIRSLDNTSQLHSLPHLTHKCAHRYYMITRITLQGLSYHYL